MTSNSKIKISSNRNFGLVFFVVFLIVALWPLKNAEDIRLWSLVLSIIFFILGVLGLVFWFGIFTSAFRYHKFFINTLHLKAKNNSLVEQMKVERSETEKVNQLLIASNQKLDASNINLEAEGERTTAELYRLSNRDPLPDLLNRNGF